MGKKIFFIGLILFGIILISINFVSSQEVSYCCEKTKTGAYCINAPQDQCDVSSGFRSTPASCEATSFCKKGFCYDSQEGICDENTPQKLCELKDGVWEEDKGETPKQCQLGCCLIGDQAAFVTQVRCERLSSLYGLEIDFRSNVNDEFTCISLAQTKVEGACVFDDGIKKTCKRATKKECDDLKQGNTTSVSFHEGFLCSAEDLGTECGPTEKTTCAENKDEVYFIDSCGNVANIYDASKIKDKNYWKDIKGKDESCNPDSANANSASCGNCNYLSGSICQSYTKADSSKPQYGDYVCKDLSCEFKGDEYQHGESWCASDSDDNSVGTNYYRYVCFNGAATVELCDIYRNKICLQDEVNNFKFAACRENKWQDCYSQKDQKDCENSDARDCKWIDGVAPLTGGEREIEKDSGACVPLNSPAFDFWQQGDAQGICSLGNAQCVVVYEKGALGKKKCVENCECLEEAWEQSMNEVCISLGDCGGKENWIGQEGYTKGYKIGKKANNSESGSSSSSSSTNTQTNNQERVSPATGSGDRIQGATGGAITGFITKLFS